MSTGRTQSFFSSDSTRDSAVSGSETISMSMRAMRANSISSDTLPSLG
jgi:hypothetical protein